MFKRLNLRSLQCKELRITSHIRISSGLVERIITPYHGHITRNTPRLALFGLIYTVNKISHVVRVDVRRVGGDEYHVEFRYLDEGWTKPPKNIKSPKLLVDFLNEEPQDIELTCNADFAYKQDEWRSVVKVPIALTPDKESKATFTHVEGIKLSRRENGHIRYWVRIEKLEDGTTKHEVSFDEPWKGKLTEEIPTLLLKHSNELSKGFVSQTRRR